MSLTLPLLHALECCDHDPLYSANRNGNHPVYDTGPWTCSPWYVMITPPPPSRKFSIGNPVKVKLPANVYSSPSAGGNIVGTHPKSSFGTVISGPWYGNHRWWWQVNFDMDPNGWVPQAKLKRNLSGMVLPNPYQVMHANHSCTFTKMVNFHANPSPSNISHSSS